MPLTPVTVERLRPLGSVFRAKDAIAEGVSWRDLYQARDSGQVVEVSRGLFQLHDTSPIDQLDFVVVCARAPRGMVCLRSALAYWDLSDEIPNRVDVAVPSGSHRPRIDYPPTSVHVFSAATFERGRVEVAVGRDVGFSITDPERTVVDAFRLRHRIGPDLAAAGLRRYLQRPQTNAGRILELAEALRARTSVLQALRVLQA